MQDFKIKFAYKIFNFNYSNLAEDLGCDTVLRPPAEVLLELGDLGRRPLGLQRLTLGHLEHAVLAAGARTAVGQSGVCCFCNTMLLENNGML
jgi:hypothetical protein